ncbi:unnamed protein product [Arctogadus glacialis]
MYFLVIYFQLQFHDNVSATSRMEGEIWRYLVRSWSAFKSQMWTLQGYLTEKTLKSHLSFIEWTHWFANDHKDAPIGRLLHGIQHLLQL